MSEEIFVLLQHVYNLGVQDGVKQTENKIKEHCKSGKPLLINENLYFVKDSKQHLIEIMDQIGRENM